MNASAAEVKDAYMRLARRFHPDTHHDPALADLRDAIVKVFVRAGQAWDVLRDPERRGPYESDVRRRRPPEPKPAAAAPSAPPPPPEPEPVPTVDVGKAIRKAETLMRQDQWWEAIQVLDAAVSAGDPGKLRNRARVLLARAYVKNPRWVREAQTILQDVIAQEPKNVEAHFLLGAIFEHVRLTSRAAEMFARVLDLDPEHEQARFALEADSAARAERFRELFRRPTADAKPSLS